MAFCTEGNHGIASGSWKKVMADFQRLTGRPAKRGARMRHARRLLAGLAAGLVMAGNSSAQVQWNGSTNQDWFLGQNWTPFGVPIGGDVDIDVTTPFSTAVFGGSTANLDLLRVGVANQGFLLIEDGSVTSIDGFIGIEEDSEGEVALFGPNASWDISSRIRVGVGGWGRLWVEHGANLTSNVSTIGLSEGSEGRVDVIGPDSTWDSGTQLTVGWGGWGILAVGGGAEVNSVNSWVGQNGGLGAVGVSTGSVWNTSGYLTVGTGGGFGDIVVQSEAELVSDQARIGFGGGQGIVSLQFGPATWSNDGDVLVGSNGSGRVEIDSESIFQVGGSITVGENSDSSGILVAGGQLQAAGGIAVLENGQLQGKGTVDAAVVIEYGGKLAPGRDHANQGGFNPGTLTLASLELRPGAELEFELDVPGAAGSDINDLVVVTGDLTLDGVINVLDAGGFEAGTYTLLTYAGTLVDNGLKVGEVPTAMYAEIDTSIPGEVRLVATLDHIFHDRFETDLFVENFDSVEETHGNDWIGRNLSEPEGERTWAILDASRFGPQAGPPGGFASNNYNATVDNGTISDWIATPLLEFRSGSTVSFWTRTVDNAHFADRLQVRLCTSSLCSTFGSGAFEVGDFTTLLLDINPNLQSGPDPTGVNGYPDSWTQFVLGAADGVPNSGTGRIAFRYFVEDAGAQGANSNYIGLDTIRIEAASMD